MRLSILCFALGVCWLQMQAGLPASGDLALLAGGGMVLVLSGMWHAGRFWRIALPVGAFIFGIGWAGMLAQQRMGEVLAEADEGRDIRVVGVVSQMPQAFDGGVRFGFTVERTDAPDTPDTPDGQEIHVPQQISLAWYRGWRHDVDEIEEREFYAAPLLHAGERWALTVRLKRPHGNVNPQGFDYEAWLLESGVRATGYVRTQPDNRRLDAFVATPATWIERLREDIRARFQIALAGRPYAGILVALAVGDQRAIPREQWLDFSRSGITHLISISGLHVTMLACLAHALVAWLWRRSPWLMRRLAAQRAGVLGGFLAALAYCLIAGFAVPAQRTLIMLAVATLALWLRRSVAVSRMLALALLFVLLPDPWAVLSSGFWLSFGAVGILFYVAGGRLGAGQVGSAGQRLAEWGRMQWAVTVGTLPALLLLFQQFSLVSPLANAIAIPLISFVVTPLVLVAAFVPPLGLLLEPAYWVTDGLMQCIHWLAALPWAVWQQHAPPPWAWLLGLAGCAWLLLPRGFPARWLGLAALLPLILAVPPRPAAGEAELVVLDVGQGLAVHVQTATHDLLYDTGPIYSAEANSGNRVIAPYLRAQGVRRLDGMIVTHRDTDHSGGTAAVLDALPTDWLMSSIEEDVPIEGVTRAYLPCRAGQRWIWDGVRFEMLHPPAALYAARPKKTNDMSCVLKVSATKVSMLLSADIEALSERALLARDETGLRADVLLAPHHGSRTSSTPEFIAAVGARTVIFPVGYRNRFGHPRADVIARYRATGAALHRTDREGALTVRLTADGVNVAGERAGRWRYWFGNRPD